MVWGGILHGVKSPLIVVPGNLTAVRYSSVSATASNDFPA